MAKRWGPYTVIDRLGVGAKVVVHKVRDERDGQYYALKRLVVNSDKERRLLHMFRTEYKLGRLVGHEPGFRQSVDLRLIRRLFTIAEAHLVLELVDGPTLNERPIREPAQFVRVFDVVAAAMESLHRHGYCHSDLKPPNIILRPNGEPVIIDLGHACPLGTIKPRIQGTPQFIAPEQMLRRAVDQRTDIYNFGATLYHCLTGRGVQQDGKAMLKSYEREQQIAEKLEQLQVPAPVLRLIVDCCQLDPARRPHSMRMVRERLGVAATAIKKGLGRLTFNGNGSGTKPSEVA